MDLLHGTPSNTKLIKMLLLFVLQVLTNLR